MTTLREAAQNVVEVWKLYGTTESLRGWMEILEAALAEPVQEPVAWIHTDPDKRRVKFLEWRENEPGYRGDWIKTPLYPAPPQRKPLSDADLAKIWDDALDQLDQRDQLRFIARAIERAHGIGGNDE